MNLVKVAVIREAGYPVGQPASCYLNCPCGAAPKRGTPSGYIPCVCGAVYSFNGYLVNSGRAMAGR